MSSVLGWSKQASEQTNSKPNNQKTNKTNKTKTNRQANKTKQNKQNKQANKTKQANNHKKHPAGMCGYLWTNVGMQECWSVNCYTVREA